MATILDALEWLTNYGLIDILFGIGIIAYIREKCRGRSVKSIDAVEIVPDILPSDGLFRVGVRNHSNENLYLNRARFLPGYYTMKSFDSSIVAKFRSLFVMTWTDDKFPRFREPKNTQGQLTLLGVTSKDEEVDSVFLRPAEEIEYPLAFEEVNTESENRSSIWDETLRMHRCGILKVHFMRGTKAGVLEAQI